MCFIAMLTLKMNSVGIGKTIKTEATGETTEWTTW